ncbi:MULTISPECIES: hypothetical protein [unclassified Tolypothrix]|uniref:hypothetical protein n=1 Tax=unclassified Tolypothrix TaxID=2649714 RepID=UPI0012D767C0|nr:MULTISPECIES: hypothetical protein [unclassified Tolypothrix]UYD25416.1 hypothetical protein HGR01_29280 [Tolypothrix sp. PCC 7712]UYD32339.1 hypothetical protein HG267_25280 [Tolypothrix sp. PCC 7601]
MSEISVIAPPVEQIPNPWELEPELQPLTLETSLIVIPFSTLKLLPPASKLQLKHSKTTKKTASTAKSKSTTDKPPRKPSRPRKKAA